MENKRCLKPPWQYTIAALAVSAKKESVMGKLNPLETKKSYESFRSFVEIPSGYD